MDNFYWFAIDYFPADLARNSALTGIAPNML
jgi:hypothetical protein